jgi:hypothetical protein
MKIGRVKKYVKIVGDGSGYEIVNENITKKIGCSIFVNGANTLG